MYLKSRYPLFNSHLDLSKFFWSKLPQGSWAIDATCGNGRDTEVLAAHFESVIAMDIQEKAIEATKQRLEDLPRVHFFCQSHAFFPDIAYQNPISLIVYNLGYLPGGGNKDLTTLTSTTLVSVEKGLDLLIEGGCISLTCYPGHAEGEKEEKALISFGEKLDPVQWSVSLHQLQNRCKSPSLLLIQKKII